MFTTGRTMNYIHNTNATMGSITDTSGITFVLMCHLYSTVLEWLQSDNISETNYNAVVGDNDTNIESGIMFTRWDCRMYGYLTNDVSSFCVNSTVKYNTDRDLRKGIAHFDLFIDCLSFHFMRELGAQKSCLKYSMMSDGTCLSYRYMTKLDGSRSCTKYSVAQESSSNDERTMSLLSKDHLFHNFLVDKINVRNSCTNTHATLDNNSDVMNDLFSLSSCNWYLQHNDSLRSICTRNTSGIDNRDLSFIHCLWYRFMKSLGIESACQKYFPVIKSCNMFDLVMNSLISTIICIIGFISNLISLIIFSHGLVKTSTTYQLQWLAAIDTANLVTYWATYVLQDTLSFFEITSDLFWHGIQPVLYVCFRPLSHVARTCTVWLTVLIGLFRYLAVCKPFSNLNTHCVQNGQRYVILIIIIGFLYSIPEFFAYYLESYVIDGRVYFHVTHTGLHNMLLYYIYDVYVYAVVITGLPFLTLVFVTVNILIVLGKQKNLRRSMQSSYTSQNNVSTIFACILATFILCQFPYLLSQIVRRIPQVDFSCGSFMFYFDSMPRVSCLLNFSINGFIYFGLNKHFRSALLSHCLICRNDIRVIMEMERVRLEP